MRNNIPLREILRQVNTDAHPGKRIENSRLQNTM